MSSLFFLQRMCNWMCLWRKFVISVNDCCNILIFIKRYEVVTGLFLSQRYLHQNLKRLQSYWDLSFCWWWRCQWSGGLLGCDTMWSCRWLPVFWRNVSLPWRWTWYIPPKHWWPPARSHSVTTQNTTVDLQSYYSFSVQYSISWKSVLRKNASHKKKSEERNVLFYNIQ
jgi:hypothetical protein